MDFFVKTVPLTCYCLIERRRRCCMILDLPLLQLFFFFAVLRQFKMRFPFNVFYVQLSLTLQTHHVYSVLKQRGNQRFHVVLTWNTRGMFVGNVQNICNLIVRKQYNIGCIVFSVSILYSLTKKNSI